MTRIWPRIGVRPSGGAESAVMTQISRPDSAPRFTPMTTTTYTTLEERIDALDWTDVRRDLDENGFAVTDQVLKPRECRELADLFDGDGFRSTIDMARHRFGDGRYRYFDHPLPALVQVARTTFYGHLAPVANAWSDRLSGDTPHFPDTHEELLERCRAAGQEQPTPLLLRYREGDWDA